ETGNDIYVKFDLTLPDTEPTGTSRVYLDEIVVFSRIDSKMYGVQFSDEEQLTLESVLTDTKVTEPLDPVKNGYSFIGWFDESDELFDFNTPITRHTTLTAKYEINEYTLTFDTDGGTAVAPIIGDYDTAVSAPAAPTKDGYTFAGWSPALPETMPAGNQTYTAAWT